MLIPVVISSIPIKIVWAVDCGTALFKNSDRMTAHAKKTSTKIQKRKRQVKEMEEDYEHERSTGLTGNKNGTKQPWKK